MVATNETEPGAFPDPEAVKKMLQEAVASVKQKDPGKCGCLRCRTERAGAKVYEFSTRLPLGGWTDGPGLCLDIMVVGVPDDKCRREIERFLMRLMGDGIIDSAVTIDRERFDQMAEKFGKDAVLGAAMKALAGQPAPELEGMLAAIGVHSHGRFRRAFTWLARQFNRRVGRKEKRGA